MGKALGQTDRQTRESMGENQDLVSTWVGLTLVHPCPKALSLDLGQLPTWVGLTVLNPPVLRLYRTHKDRFEKEVP
jgi:hypothetical protein